jgi:hypothetical protein
MSVWPKKEERDVRVCVRFAEKKKQEDKQMGRQNKGLESRERKSDKGDCEATMGIIMER